MVEPVFGRWGPTEVMERVLDGTWAEVVDGMGLIEPESIVFSGTSAAITGLGSVEFTAVSSLSLNGVFSTDFDNYMLVMRAVGSVANFPGYRLRSASVDSTTSYTRQFLFAGATTVSAGRTTGAEFFDFGTSTSLRSGSTSYWYGPHLAQPTVARFVAADARDAASFNDYVGTHSQSVSYDGLTIYANTGNLTGRVAVYGMVK